MPVRPPSSLGAAGRRLWRDVTSEYELSGADRFLLEQACHTADRCARLQEMVDQGLLTRSRLGEIVIAPPVRELRQQQIVLARLLAALRVVGDLAEDGDRPQRRVGVRGVYGLRAVTNAETAG